MRSLRAYPWELRSIDSTTLILRPVRGSVDCTRAAHLLATGMRPRSTGRSDVEPSLVTAFGRRPYSLTGLQLGREALLHVGVEGTPGHRPVEHHRCDDAFERQRRRHRDVVAPVLRNGIACTLAERRPRSRWHAEQGGPCALEITSLEKQASTKDAFGETELGGGLRDESSTETRPRVVICREATSPRCLPAFDTVAWRLTAGLRVLTRSLPPGIAQSAPCRTLSLVRLVRKYA